MVKLIILLAFTCVSFTKSNNLPQRWENIINFVEVLVSTHEDRYVNVLKHITNEPTESNLSLQCLDSLKALRNGFIQKKKWAKIFYDSSGFGLPNIFNGGHADFGDYDSCIATKVSVEDSGIGFNGQYCTIRVPLPLPTDGAIARLNLKNTSYHNTKWEKQLLRKIGPYLYLEQVFGGSLCVPSTCTRDELGPVINELYKSVTGEDLIFAERCDTEEENWKNILNYPWTQILSLLMIILITSAIIIFTALSIILPKVRILNCCNIFENSKILFKTSVNEEALKLASIHGIRNTHFLIQVGVHILLAYGWAPEFAGDLPTFHLKTKDDHVSRFFGLGMNAVVMMFFLGGLVSSYSWSNVISDQKGKIKFMTFFLTRMIRTLPPIFGSLLLVLILPMTGSGPLYQRASWKLANTCQNQWWAPVLQLNTYMAHPLEMCLPQTWYISADFHLYLISFWPLLWLYTDYKKGIKSITILLILGFITPFIEHYSRGLPVFCNVINDDIENHLTSCYHSLIFFNNYVLYYFIGVLYGYILHSKKLDEIHLSNLQWSMGLITVGVLNTVPYLLPPFWMNPHTNVLVIYIFLTVYRFVMVFGLAFIIWACSRGKAVIINAFLASKMMVPTSRMSFSLYMSHFVFLWYNTMRRRQHLNFRPTDIILEYFKALIPVFALGFYVYLIYEAPVNNLMKYFMVPEGTKAIKSEKKK